MPTKKKAPRKKPAGTATKKPAAKASGKRATKKTAQADSAKTPSKASTATKKPGRPKGATTQSLPTAEAQLTRCRKCGSTDRTPYRRTTETAHNGQHQGQPYTHIVRRWTSCAACGQARVDMTHENRTS